jgi:hypothetical protein
VNARRHRPETPMPPCCTTERLTIRIW